MKRELHLRGREISIGSSSSWTARDLLITLQTLRDEDLDQVITSKGCGELMGIHASFPAEGEGFFRLVFEEGR